MRLRLIRFGICIVLLSLLVSMVAGCQQSFQPGTFVDDMGREVTIEEIPERIVSHVPGITEILFALGLGERVVGVSEYCDYPEEAKSKPKVGGFWNPSMEGIVALDPDLVFTMGSVEYVMTQLDSLEIPCIALQPKDMNGVLKNIELVGKVTGTEGRADKLIRDMQDSISHVLALVEDAPRPKVFYIIEATDLTLPWTAGPGSFIDTLITMAGGENIAAEAPGVWVQFSIEQVVSSDPEIIILPAKHGTAFTSPEVLQGHPIWQKVTAVKQDRICIIDGDLVDRYGPRIVQGLEEIARIIHPELFE